VADAGNCDERGADGAPDVEPDYRFTLANERTFLAWQRTALGLLAAAVAVIQFVPSLSVPGARHVLGVLLGALSILTATIGIRRWERCDRAMRRGQPLPRQPTPVYLGIGLVVITVLALALVVVKALTG
jgi:putative membrane protein